MDHSNHLSEHDVASLIIAGNDDELKRRATLYAALNSLASRSRTTLHMTRDVIVAHERGWEMPLIEALSENDESVIIVHDYEDVRLAPLQSVIIYTDQTGE